MLRIFPVSLLLTGVCSISFAADPSLLALAPSNSQVVAAINVDGSRNSAFGQFLLRRLNLHDEGFQHLVEQTGFDPRRDLQSLLLTASPQNSKTPGRFVVLARGNFDQSRIKAAAQKNGSVIQQFGGIDLLVGNQGSGQTAFAFPDVDLAIMGDLLSVKQVIQNRANPTNLDPALQSQISKVEANDAWFASISPLPSFTGNVDPSLKRSMNQAQVLQSITQSSGGISLGNTSEITLNAETRSDQDATALADVVHFVSSMLQMQRGKDPRADLLTPVLDSMKLEVAGSSVHIALDLPEAVLEQFVNSQPKPARMAR